MPGVLSTLLIAAGILAILFRFLRSLQEKGKASSLPPGPKATPIVGNINDMPTKEEWKTYTEWAKKYGDIVYVHTFGRPIIFLNTFETARDLLDKRSSIYSDRVQPPMLMDLLGQGWNFGFMPYNATWRRHRNLFTEHFQPSFAQRYLPIQEQEIHRFLKRLLDNPEKFLDQARYTAGAVIIRVTYGIVTASKDDPLLALAVESNESFSRAATPGAWLVDIIPFLKYVPHWMPGAKFKRLAAEWKVLQDTMRDYPFDLAKKSWRNGAISPCAAETMLSALSEKTSSPAEEDVIRNCLGIAYAAGEDTVTALSLGTFFLAMVLFPEVQKKAQAEIDRIIGGARLPSFDDRPNLPYLEAIVKETLRFHPATPQGIPHRVVEDDTYNGYLIPKGSLIIPNVWYMLHNESVYRDPNVFRPERFLGPNVSKEAMDSASAGFGFGRRVCPGRHIAEATLWISIACTLAAFDITNETNRQGDPIIPDLDFKSGTLSGPLPFKCEVRPRSSAARTLVENITENMG